MHVNFLLRSNQYFPPRVLSSPLSIVVCAHRAPRRDTTSPHGSSQALLHDIVEELEKRGIVCDCHMNFVRDLHARALDVRDEDQCTMEELDNKLFPKTRRGKRDKYHPPTTKKPGDDQLGPPELKRQKCGRRDQEEEEEDPRFDSGGELLFDAETEDVEGAKSSFSATRLQSLNPPPKQPKSRGQHRSNEEIHEMNRRKKGGGARYQ